MSYAKLASAQPRLMDAHIVDVEVDLSQGLHSFSVVGLADKAVDESKDRVSAAIKNSGYDSPKHSNQKIVISLAPADIKKEGPLFDLCMAVAYLVASEQIYFEGKNVLLLGELSLDGSLRPIRGTLPLVNEAKKRGLTEVILPRANAEEAALLEGITVYGAETLAQVVDHLNENLMDKKKDARIRLRPQPKTEVKRLGVVHEIDFADIKGNASVKRGLEVCAAGGHNALMHGPPGTGKTMLAKAFASILPPLSFDEIFETTAIHSVAGVLNDVLNTEPPFRAPHHTSSYVSIIGGGAVPKPGEVTLAHKGVLFLDEFPEYDRRVIESLRQPLESRHIALSRARGSSKFPADFILIAAMNPCPCGNFGIKNKKCTCTPTQVHRYQRKISGPIVDRIDAWMEVSEVNHRTLTDSNADGATSEVIRERVRAAREKQAERYKKAGIKAKTNAEVSGKDVAACIRLTNDAKDFLNRAAENLGLSARVYHRIMKIGRTIADLEGKELVEADHISEALQYRPKAE